MPRSVGFEISQAWSANPPQMVPDRQIKEMTVMAGSSYLLMDCWWWQSPPTFLTHLVRGFIRLQIQKSDSLSELK